MKTHSSSCRRKLKIQGFSLVELLIVVGVLLILASIAVPNLLKARRSANEASAIASLRAIASGQLAYRDTQGQFTNLIGLNQEEIIDDVLLSGTKSGYNFMTAPGAAPSLEFTATAAPVVPSGIAATGNRYFFVSQDQVIRFEIGTAADSTSSPLND
jgi:type IV pilus assembly protein PilA